MPNAPSVKSQSSLADGGKKRMTEAGGNIDVVDPKENEPAVSSDGQQINDVKPVEVAATDNSSSNNEGAQENMTPGRTIQSAMTKVQGSASEGTGTSISSQIQKIIARELVPAGKRGKIDLQSIPMREYLEQTVIPIVHQGMLALARERPESPIEYLAAYFLKHKNKYQYVPEIMDSDKHHSVSPVRPSDVPPVMGTSPQMGANFFPHSTPPHHNEHSHHPNHHSNFEPPH